METMEKEIITAKDLDGRPIMFSATGKGRSENVPVNDEILELDENDNLVRKHIRYIPGEPTIYVEGQSEKADKKPSKIVLRDGVLMVSQREILLLEYLSKCDYNGSKEDRDGSKNALFTENVPGKRAQEELELDRQDSDIRHLVHTMPFEEIQTYAMVLGVKNADSKDSDSLRWDVLQLATANPDAFERGMNDMPKMKRKFHILNAIKFGIIEKVDNVINWKNAGQIIMAPLGKDPVDNMVNFTYQEQGAPVYDEIKRQLYPERKVQPTAQVESKPTEAVSKAASFNSKSEFLDAAIEAGAIIQKGPWYHLKGTEKGDQYHAIVNKRESLENQLATDKDLREAVVAYM